MRQNCFLLNRSTCTNLHWFRFFTIRIKTPILQLKNFDCKYGRMVWKQRCYTEPYHTCLKVILNLPERFCLCSSSSKPETWIRVKLNRIRIQPYIKRNRIRIRSSIINIYLRYSYTIITCVKTNSRPDKGGCKKVGEPLIKITFMKLFLLQIDNNTYFTLTILRSC